jgi:hypothetical protein
MTPAQHACLCFVILNSIINKSKKGVNMKKSELNATTGLRKLDQSAMQNLSGGVCQSFPGNANPPACFPQPCWAGVAIGIVFGPGTNPGQEIACIL